MARTIDEIKQNMYDRQPSLFPELSTSGVAEWSLWVDVVAYAIWVFENIMDLFRADVEDKLSKQKPGSLPWLATKAYEFQFGDDLMVDANGIVKYATIDEAKKIVKRVSASESNGVISLKVAKLDNQTSLVPLDVNSGELLQFERYIEKLKYAGVKVDVVSLPADVLLYNVDVYFDPAYLESTITANVNAKLDEYRLSLPFNGMIYRSEVLNAILSAEGVVTAKINELTGTQSTITNIDVKYLLVAGYFNWDETSTLNLINNAGQ